MQGRLATWIVCASMILGGCFDGGGGGGGRHGNKAPTIAGSPVSGAVPDSEYVFQPSASDSDGDALNFLISNKPDWLQFDAATGRLYGTPGAHHVGEYQEIEISVTDGTKSTNLPRFAIIVYASGEESATLSWNPPTENADGSPLLDLAGYKIYFGHMADRLDRVIVLSNPGLTRYLVENLYPETWFFAMSSFNARGDESGRSPTVSKRIT
jgi:Putative Ig domain